MELNLKKTLKLKAPKLYAKLPNFVIGILAKLIRQNKLNAILSHCDGKQGMEFLTSALDFMGIERNSIIVGDIDSEKKYIYASNHPLGCLDGLAILETTNRIGGGTKIVVNDILMNIEPLQELFIPITKFGMQSHSSGTAINESFESGDQVIFFPAGICSRKINGEIIDLAWKKTFITKAIEYKRDIIPVYIDNTNTNLFYFLASLRKKVGIKFNIEMALLPSEMFKKSVKKMKLIYGQPISYKLIESSGDINYWVDKVRKECYELKKYADETNN